MVILGHSGYGKTTLLRCVNFLEQADKGEFLIDDLKVCVTNVTKADIARIRKRTAFVFQNYNLFSNKTALENVKEGLIATRKVPKSDAIRIAKQALNKVGLWTGATITRPSCPAASSSAWASPGPSR